MPDPSDYQPLNLRDFALVLDTQQQIHALPAGPELYPQLAVQFGSFMVLFCCRNTPSAKTGHALKCTRPATKCCIC